MSDTPLQNLLLTRRDAVLTIKLDRPDKLNAFTYEMSRDLLRCVREAGDDDTVRVVVLTAEGRAFSTGGDLSLEDSFTAASFRKELEFFAEMVLALLTCPKPVICALNGDAVGWGATLALYCDVIIAARHARIGDPHVNVGLSTGDGASIIWPQLVGYPRARQFLLTGEFVDASTAASWGLINEAVEAQDLLPRANELADRIAAKPPLAVSMTKASINEPLKLMVRTHMDAYIGYELATQQSPQHPQAVAAFLNRRKK